MHLFSGTVGRRGCADAQAQNAIPHAGDQSAYGPDRQGAGLRFDFDLHGAAQLCDGAQTQRGKYRLHLGKSGAQRPEDDGELSGVVRKEERQKNAALVADI